MTSITLTLDIGYEICGLYMVLMTKSHFTQVPSMSSPQPLQEIGQAAGEGDAVALYTIKWSDSTEGIRVSRKMEYQLIDLSQTTSLLVCVTGVLVGTADAHGVLRHRHQPRGVGRRHNLGDGFQGESIHHAQKVQRLNPG